MSEMYKNLYYGEGSNAASRIGIAVSRYNPEITQTLLKSCVKTLIEQGMNPKLIQTIEAPGAFELPYTCQKMAVSKKFDALIALGAVVRGGTPHFDYVCDAATRGLVEVSLKHHIPIIFGVLTTDNQGQAKDRIHGGKHGDKGVEAALTALRMVAVAKTKLEI